MKLLPWEAKAHRIIYKLCEESYKQTNFKKNGRRYKKRRAYAVPELAQKLVECLGNPDESEERAKALFLSYDGIKALSS